MPADSSTATVTHSGEDGGGGGSGAGVNWAQVVRGGNELDLISQSPAAEVVDRIPDPVTAPTETQLESSDGGSDSNADGVKKSAWNKPSSVVVNGVVEGSNSPVMGAASWPALSESTRPGVKFESSSKPISDISSAVSPVCFYIFLYFFGFVYMCVFGFQFIYLLKN